MPKEELPNELRDETKNMHKAIVFFSKCSN